MNWSPNSSILRPIVGLSDYVVEKMPLALATTGIDIDEIAALAHKVHDRLASPLASLDCKMLEMALVQSNIAVPTWLTGLTNELSGDRPRGILYEEIVLANPEADRRTFTTGKIGETEDAFYYAHDLIEHTLKLLLEKLNSDAQTINPENLEGLLNSVIAVTAELGRIPSGHFDSFRPYLASHPIRGTKGPSGLFSPGMAELQLRSGFLPGGFIDFLHANLAYYPVQAWPKIQMALLELEENTTRIHKNPALAAKLRRFWDQWRKVHLASINRHVPSISHGTGGETDPITFLKNRMNIQKS